jgi:hypothetical protein
MEKAWSIDGKFMESAVWQVCQLRSGSEAALFQQRCGEGLSAQAFL